MYDKKSDVVVLTDSSFTGTRITKGFVHAGVLKVYAPWCGFCQTKEQCIYMLAKCLKEEGEDISVYVIDGDSNKQFSMAAEVSGFPTFLRIDEYGNVTGRLAGADGEPVHDVPSILGALCEECVSRDGFKDQCFKQ